MDSEFKDMLPGSLQAYANFGMAAVVFVIGVVGYYRKIRASSEMVTPSSLMLDRLGERHKSMMDWLEKIYNALLLGNENTEASHAEMRQIVTILQSREHRDELEREYRRGRDERYDSRTARTDREARDRERDKDKKTLL